MATPLLRALRRGLPEARIVGVGRPTASILDGLPFLDEVRLGFDWRSLRRERFDAAVILPNSFRSALLVRLAGVPRRVGYARDGRGCLLTDKARPALTGNWPRRRFAVMPTLRYYLGLLRPLGLPEAGRRMELGVTDDEAATADRVLAAAGIEDDGRPFVLLNPGASYGAAKLWPPEHFAALADRAAGEWDARVAASVAPSERPIVDEINRHANRPVADLSQHGLTLGAVKAICRRADVIVTNDTGTRHVAAAMGRPVVTLFGPTDSRWTTIGHPRERELAIEVPCGPCQLKVCPLPEPGTKRCLWGIAPEVVFEAARDVMSHAPAPQAGGLQSAGLT